MISNGGLIAGHPGQEILNQKLVIIKLVLNIFSYWIKGNDYIFKTSLIHTKWNFIEKGKGFNS